MSLAITKKDKMVFTVHWLSWKRYLRAANDRAKMTGHFLPLLFQTFKALRSLLSEAEHDGLKLCQPATLSHLTTQPMNGKACILNTQELPNS